MKALCFFSETRDRKLLKSVAVHELGHSLGFSHSPLRDSIMYKYYRNEPEPSLHRVDIELLHSLYGEWNQYS